MITVHAPITVNQFDETRFARMEQALEEQKQRVVAMETKLDEVLASRQAQFDALSERLEGTSSRLKDVVDLVSAQTQTKKEGQ